MDGGWVGGKRLEILWRFKRIRAWFYRGTMPSQYFPASTIRAWEIRPLNSDFGIRAPPLHTLTHWVL
jgi:hypothetical protein